MVALDKPFVPFVESLKKSAGRDEIKFSIRPSVAVSACKHQIPYTVYIEGVVGFSHDQAVGKKVIHVSKIIGIGIVDDYVLKAEETFTLLECKIGSGLRMCICQRHT
jgi:hypothetical protein